MNAAVLRGLRAAVVLGIGLFAASAHADAAPYPSCARSVDAAESELAHQKYIAGRQDYEEANYDSAVRRFRDAYALDCAKHELLVIIAAAYERKGDESAAIAALEAFIARVPSDPAVGTYEAKIANLRKQLATKRPAPDEPVLPAPETASPPPERQHTVVPWVVAAAGGVALGVGIVLIATAPDLPRACDDASRSCSVLAGESPADFAQRKGDAGKAASQPVWGAIVTAGGAALVVSGILWHFLEPSRAAKDPTKATFRPELGPGIAGASFGGVF